MNNQEAIELIKIARSEVEWEYPMDYAAAFDMALEALEKQIPKKANGDHYAWMRCPFCNHRIPSGKGSSSRRRDNWCNYCGQAIDWEVDDDESGSD